MKRNRKGRELEIIINNSLKEITDENIGYFVKSPIPNKLLKINNTYKFIFSSKALCDFVGIYKEKFILIECKEIDQNRFPKERLKQHQINQLVKIYDQGGFSFIIFHLKSCEKIVALTITNYLHLLFNEKKKSISIIDIEKIGYILTEINSKVDLTKLFDHSIMTC